MSRDDLQLYVTDRDLKPVSDAIPWVTLNVEARYREPGAGILTARATDPMLNALAPGNRIAFYRNGVDFLSGPIEKPGIHVWSADDDASGPGTLTIQWTDDLALIAGRKTYPVYNQPATNQVASARYADTDLAGTLITELVDRNAGPNAHAGPPIDRRVPHLQIGTGAGLGSSITVSTRFESLLDVCRTLADLSTTELGFRTRVDGGAVYFDVYVPQDRPGVIFSRGLRNLTGFSYEPEAPKVTAAIVGGAGSGASRSTRLRQDATAVSDWWLMEDFVNQSDTSNITELDQAGDAALAEGSETAAVSFTTIESADYRYGTAFNLGDKVYVSPRDGLRIADVVRAAVFQADINEGTQVTNILVGNEQASNDPTWVKAVRALSRRTGKLETT
jgi:hypothetical protein